jgi:hypothetical protein
MDHLKQGRFAGAVAADQPDVLALIDDEGGSIEERLQSESELGILKGDERHPWDYPKAGRRHGGFALRQAQEGRY